MLQFVFRAGDARPLIKGKSQGRSDIGGNIGADRQVIAAPTKWPIT